MKKILIPTKDEVKIFGNKDNKLVEPTEEKIKIFDMDIVRQSTNKNRQILTASGPKFFKKKTARTEIEVLPEVIPNDPIKNLSTGWYAIESVATGKFYTGRFKGADSESSWQDLIEDILNEDDKIE